MAGPKASGTTTDSKAIPPHVARGAQETMRAITSARRPEWVDLETWDKQSSAEQLASITPSAGGVQLARADVRGNQIFVRPERSDFPSVILPNNVGAEGFSPGWLTHDYLVAVYAPPGLRDPSALAAVGAALIANPTPGRDFPATATGAVNNIGHLTGIDHGSNLVRSYRIPATNPRRSATVVNYTIEGQHTMAEGFVLRFAELKRDLSVVLVTYGEGDAFRQTTMFSPLWWKEVKRVWKRNALEILDAAWRANR